MEADFALKNMEAENIFLTLCRCHTPAVLELRPTLMVGLSESPVAGCVFRFPIALGSGSLLPFLGICSVCFYVFCVFLCSLCLVCLGTFCRVGFWCEWLCVILQSSIFCLLLVFLIAFLSERIHWMLCCTVYVEKVIQCGVFVLCSIYWFPVCFVQFLFEFLLIVLAKYPDHRSAVCLCFSCVLFDYSKVGQVICYVTVYVTGVYFFRYWWSTLLAKSYSIIFFDPSKLYSINNCTYRGSPPGQPGPPPVWGRSREQRRWTWCHDGTQTWQIWRAAVASWIPDQRRSISSQ